MTNSCISSVLYNLDYKFILHVIIIVIGWVIVHKLTVNRDFIKTKKENSIKVIDDAVKMLEELSLLAIKYHTCKRNVNDEFEIKSKIQNFSRFIYSIEKLIGRNEGFSECTNYIKKLRQAITSSHFEDEHTEEILITDNVLKDIADVQLSFRQKLIDVKFDLLINKI